MTRLGDFLNVLVNKFSLKIVQIFGNFVGKFELWTKASLPTFWTTFGEIGILFVNHLVALLAGASKKDRFSRLRFSTADVVPQRRRRGRSSSKEFAIRASRTRRSSTSTTSKTSGSKIFTLKSRSNSFLNWAFPGLFILTYVLLFETLERLSFCFAT